MDANPPKLGINWASSLEVALRAISWLWALHLLADSNLLTEHLALRLLKSLTTHGRHIETYLSHYHSPNTHLTGEALGLFYLGTALPELSRAAALAEAGIADSARPIADSCPARRGLFRAIVLLSPLHHRLLYPSIAAGESEPTRLCHEVWKRNSHLLLDHLMWITRPDGTSPFYGDDDGGRLIVLGERTGR